MKKDFIYTTLNLIAKYDILFNLIESKFTFIVS